MAFQLNKSCQMQRQGILSAKEAQFQAAWKGSVDTVSRRIFLCAVMSSSFVLQRNQNDKIGYLSQCLPCFITVACAGLHLGVLLPSFVFVFVMVRQWSLLLAAVHLLSECVCHFLTFHQTRVICLFSWLCSPADAVPCYTPAQPLFFSSLSTVLIMHALFLLEKLICHEATGITMIDYWVLDLK